MRYFELRQGKNVRNPIKLQWAQKNLYKYNPTKEEFDAFPKAKVGYYDYSDMVEIPDVLESDTLFVGEEVKHVLSMYDETIEFKGVQIYPFGMEEDIVPSYWTFYPREAACLHSSAKILPNGELEELILDSKKIPKADVFKVSGISVYRVIVTLPVAESLLRRKPFGISLREVKAI